MSKIDLPEGSESFIQSQIETATTNIQNVAKELAKLEDGKATVYAIQDIFDKSGLTFFDIHETAFKFCGDDDLLANFLVEELSEKKSIMFQLVWEIIRSIEGFINVNFSIYEKQDVVNTVFGQMLSNVKSQDEIDGVLDGLTQNKKELAHEIKRKDLVVIIIERMNSIIFNSPFGSFTRFELEEKIEKGTLYDCIVAYDSIDGYDKDEYQLVADLVNQINQKLERPDLEG